MTKWIDPERMTRRRKLKQLKDNLTYTKEDLISLLKRHSGKDPICDCNCPYTGHSVSMLIQFVCSENELDPKVQKKALDLYKSITNKVCFIGTSRLVLSAAFVYIAALHIHGYGHYSQEFLSVLFCTTTVSIRIRYKAIVPLLPAKAGYRYRET